MSRRTEDLHERSETDERESPGIPQVKGLQRTTFNSSRLALRGVAGNGGTMDKRTALRVMESLDERVCWSQAEYEQGVEEAKSEGEEPMANPHVFSVRLDAHDKSSDYSRDYRVRVTPGEYDVGYEDWRSIIDLAEQHKCGVMIQNNGIELA